MDKNAPSAQPTPLPPSPHPVDHANRDETRARILAAAARLVEQGGGEAATTRAVAAAAGVQAPTIYRLFGDKRGLLDAVALESLHAYVIAKTTRAPDPDPLQDLRDGWDLHVAFSVANPGIFDILSGNEGGPASQTLAHGLQALHGKVRRIALAGRLRTSEERAVNLLRAVGRGTVLTLLAQPEEARDEGLAASAREAVMAAITHTGEAPAPANPDGAAARANAAAAALRASLDEVPVLSEGERHLLTELLDRIARGG